MAGNAAGQKRAERSNAGWLAVGACAYVAVVLALDTLGAHPNWMGANWSFLGWRFHGFDFFKFVWWFCVPFAVCLPALDWGSLGVSRWRRGDVWLLSGLLGAGALAVLSILVFPSLSAQFSGMGGAPWGIKLRYALANLAWTVSWLPGWEFMHRYFLLRAVQRAWPKWGWLLVPLAEGVYHLQQPLPMAAGMVAFSLVATAWAVRRRNLLLPFIAHLFVELALLVFMLIS